MTTIASDGETIAYDSRETIGHIIHDDNCNKHLTNKRNHYFLACNSSDEPEIIAAFEGDGSLPEDTSDFEGIVYSKGTVYRVVGHEGTLIKEPQRSGNFLAVGTGAMFALAAMDLGCTATEAVRQAIKRDTCSGGRVRKFKL